MRLVIAEKKLTAEALATALFDKHEYRNSTFRAKSGKNQDIVIAHCRGHLISLKDPHEYNPSLEKWDLATLPFVFREPKYNVNPDTKDLFNNIKGLMKEADAIYHAGDPDDEGQLIVDEIINFVGFKKNVYRVLFSDNNPEIVLKAFNSATPNDKHAIDGFKALGRSLCDWHYGLNLTRAYTCLNRRAGKEGVVSLGRVQDAIKGLVVRRDREIAAFVPKDFFTINCQSSSTGTILKPRFLNDKCTEIADFLDEDNRLINSHAAKNIVEYLKQNPNLKVITISDEEKSTKPPLPYNLLKLQIDMNRKYGLSMDKTLDITQSLRDKYNAITYNRSDCQYLSDETYNDADKILSVIGQNAPVFNGKLAKTNTAIKSKCFNSKKVTAHHAIIPTFDNFDISKLSEDEKRCYLLIARSFIAQFFPDKKYKVRSVILKSMNDAYTFSLSAKQTINLGWEELYKNDADNDETKADKDIPEISINLTENMIIPLDTGTDDEGKELIYFDTKRTKPPKHYTEDTLALELTRVARYIKDPELKRIMIAKDADVEGEHGGIGTPATRSEIMKNLKEKQFLLQDGKKLIASEKAHILYDMLPDPVRYPDLTALWQRQMNDILNRSDVDHFLTDVMKQVTHLIVDVKERYNGIEVKEYKCPDCENGKLVKKRGKAEFFWGCDQYQNGCKYTCTDLNNEPTFQKPVFNNVAFNQKKGRKRTPF
ncbi:DNA topoisomerase [Acinetobacter pittii]|uniref:DNA topoisomerase n=1 Tax=Acinetobacter pittii TaxID=48296 RepID=UPI003260CC15